MANIKGYVFEYFVWRLLMACGFKQVLPDGNIIYNSSNGIMIHGLGQAHNADVLVSPPIQIPFYFPTRLIVECKCYTKPLGLQFARNILGLREDINNFDIVTPEILDKRKKYLRRDAAIYSFDRFRYQVALASVSGFKYTTEEFALVHRIPLISFSKSILFRDIRSFLTNIDDLFNSLDSDEKKRVLRFFRDRNNDYIYNVEDIIENEAGNNIRNFLNNLNEIEKHMCFGVLENGTILFLYREENDRNNIREYYNGFKIYWSDNKKSWLIKTNEYNYYFELPASLMRKWNNMVGDWKEEFRAKMRTLDFKAEYFPKISIYNFEEGKTSIDILEISEDFLSRAIRDLEKNYPR